jgi:surface antigen
MGLARLAAVASIVLAVVPTTLAGTAQATTRGPVVTSVAPAAGRAGGGTRVTVEGSGFSHVTAVRFGRVKGSAVRVISSHKLRVTAPRHAPGRFDIRVATRSATSPITRRDRYTFVPRPKAPTAVTATPVGLHALRLRWTNHPTTHVTGVMIRRSTGVAPSTPGGGTLVASVANGTTAYTDGGLGSNVRYRYALFTKTSVGTYSPPAHVAATTRTDTLVTDGVLRAGHAIWSPSGHYEAVVQTDGNFVVYGPSGPTWASNTAGSGARDFLAMQGDGNLVLYTAEGGPVWSSSTAPSQNDHLTMQDDGNLVIYSTHGAVWSAHGITVLGTGLALDAGGRLTSPNGAYQAAMQGDGNFVVYGPAGAKWGSNTSGSHNWVVMQGDGNLVVYSSDNRPLWASNTGGTGGNNRLVMQDDGNLVVYTGDGHPVWALPAARGVIGDDYPSNLRNAAQDSMFDPWRFYNRECTSFVAWRLNSQNGVDFTDFYRGPRWGDASNWGPTARSLGIPVDSTPKPGAVAWESGGDHVAWVADVRSDGSIDIEEYNHDFHGTYSTRHVAASTFSYIHIHDLG